MIGTALIIITGRRKGLISNILSSQFFVGVGKISYALYLWHWPLLVVARILYPDARVEVAISALLIAVLASVTSYYLIEAPIRGKKIFPSIKAAYICLAVSFIGIFSLATSGQAGIVKEARLKYVYGENALIVKNIEAEKNEYYKRVNLNFNGKI